MEELDLIIIGAGPAGMAAADEAARGGATVLILDDQAHPGGQIYRNVGANGDDLSYLGKDYSAGARLVAGLDHANISFEASATVWRIEAGPRIVWSQNGKSQIARARHVVLAVGAQERPIPFDGWTLPGVMPVGGAQILMKSSRLLPKDAVLAGSGPLIYLVASQLIDAGAPPLALVETQTAGSMLRALKHLPRALRGTSTLAKGLGLIRKVRSAGVPRYQGASSFSATATDDDTLRFSFVSKGRSQELECSLLLVHQGVVPSTHMSRAAGIRHTWDSKQLALKPKIRSIWGETSKSGIHIVGDASGIGGADAAIAAGRLAAINVLFCLNRIDQRTRDTIATRYRRAYRKAMSVRPFLDTAYAPPAEFLSPKGKTIICRCEDITAAEVACSIAQGASGPRQVKASVRAGMGPCQGRMCELAVRGMLRTHGIEPEASRVRSPIKPIKLGELAALPQDLGSSS